MTGLQAEAGRRADLYREMVALRDRYGALIEEGFPKIPRLVSGFENLDALLPGRDFNVARALTGTEGSCAIILDATLQLVPRPKCKAIALLSFDDVYAAADAVPALLEQRPDAIEGFDGKLYDAVRATGAGHGGLAAFPEGRGFLIVEAGGDSRDEAEANVRRMVEEAKTGARTASSPTRTSSSASGKRARRRSAQPLSFAGSRNIGPAGKTARCRPTSSASTSAISKSCSRSTVIPPRCTAISATA